MTGYLIGYFCAEVKRYFFRYIHLYDILQVGEYEDHGNGRDKLHQQRVKQESAPPVIVYPVSDYFWQPEVEAIAYKRKRDQQNNHSHVWLQQAEYAGCFLFNAFFLFHFTGGFYTECGYWMTIPRSKYCITRSKISIFPAVSEHYPLKSKKRTAKSRKPAVKKRVTGWLLFFAGSGSRPKNPAPVSDTRCPEMDISFFIKY